MKSSAILPVLISLVAGQTTCSLPGFSPGLDTVIFTTPYTYSQVLSIIGSYKNITWNGTPPENVTLNGTDNTVGTARTYDFAGARVVETITVYNSPPGGPYEEIHVVDLLTVPSLNVSLYSDYDATTVVGTCGGRASTFNFTAEFCADNVTVAGELLHSLHLAWAQNVGIFLGGQNFTTCAALEAGENATATANATGSARPAQVTASGVDRNGVTIAGFVLVYGGLFLGLGL